jgi:HemY protein
VTRLIGILVVAGLLAAGMAWLADREGALFVTLGQYEVRMSVGVAFGLLVAIVVALFFALRTLTALWQMPSWIGDWWRARRARKGYQALSQGLVAAAAGDALAARRYARSSRRLLKGAPLGLLLTAQAAQLDGDEKRQASAYRAMLEHPDTEFLGLRGLFMQAMRRDAHDEAHDYAARAHKLKPKAAWAANALFDLSAQRHEWRGALTILERQQKARLIDSQVARRRRAVLLAAQAVEAERDGEDAEALSYALDALALSPGLAPAAAIAARHLSSSGRTWKAQDAIEAAWSQSPHPDLAAAYAAIRPEEDTEAKAKRMKGLAQLNPSHFESRILAAEQAIALKRWTEAHASLDPISQAFPTARICALMAELAEKERGDKTSAQHWLARAVKAQRDAHWACGHCGWSGADWTAVCPNCGAFDSLTWSTPAADVLERLAPEFPADEWFEPLVEEMPAHDVHEVIIEAGPPQAISSRPEPVFAHEGTISLPRPPDDPGPELDADLYDEGATKPVRPVWRTR